MVRVGTPAGVDPGGAGRTGGCASSDAPSGASVAQVLAGRRRAGSPSGPPTMLPPHAQPVLVATLAHGRRWTPSPSQSRRRWSSRPGHRRFRTGSRIGHGLCSGFVRNPFSSPLWSNRAFVRVWSAASISIFGSLITGMALPLTAILVLGAGAVEVAILSALQLGAALVFGLVAGAWVDRLRRRPVLIWADLGRSRSRLDPGRLRVRRADVRAAARGRGAGLDPHDVLRRGRQRVPADDRRARRSSSRLTALSRRAAPPPSSRVRHRRLPRPMADRPGRDRG